MERGTSVLVGVEWEDSIVKFCTIFLFIQLINIIYIYTPIVRKVLIYRAKEDKVAVILYLAPNMGKSKCRVDGRITKSFGRSLCHAWPKVVERKRCKFEGWNKFAQGKGDVCVTHGAKVKRCNF